MRKNGIQRATWWLTLWRWRFSKESLTLGYCIIQNTGKMYRELLAANGMLASMSGKGDCWDNAPTESFFSSLKREQVHHQNYEIRNLARTDIFLY